MPTKPETAWPPKQLAAGVVLYHPPAEASGLIEILVAEFDQVFVVENESRTFEAADLPIQRIFNTTNRGLAAANNQLCQAAREAGFEWLVLFDQDSRVPRQFRSRFAEYFEALDKPPALLAANYRTELLGESFSGYRTPPGQAVTESVVALNSGSMIHLPLHLDLGGHDESFFVDHVDHEYCLGLRRASHSVLTTSEPLFRHEIGNVVCVRRFGRVWQSSGHCAERREEWARNLVRLVKRYWKTEPAWCARRLFGEVPRSVTAMLILEKGKCAKFAAIVSGLMSGILGPR
ncbi:MAG TPA: hypothetical protein VJ904_05350 [Tichowtungia sp.]|nr:hypothetical protein [Tichowtungia sp.]